MAKLTLADVKTVVNAVVDATLVSIDSPFVPTYETITGLVDKIGKQLMLDSNFGEKLNQLDGEPLPFGQTIEEYFVDLVLPVNYDPSGATDLAPKRLTFEDTAYSYALAKKTIPVTVDMEKFEQAMLGPSELSALTAYIIKRLYDSLAVYRYGLKKQLLGRMIDMVGVFGAGNKKLVHLAKPTDTATAEAFAKAVKNKVEYATKLHDDMSINGVVASSEKENLTLFILEGIESVLDIDLQAGAFNVGKVQVPVNIEVVEDFGTLAVHTGTYAVLVDTRGVKLHTAKQSARQSVNGQGEFINYYLHYQPTGFISKSVNVCAFKPAP